MSPLLETQSGPRPSVAPTAITAGIVGLGSAVPRRAVDNDTIGAPLGIDDAWIQRRTGIRSRRRISADESFTGLAIEAATAAIADAGIRPAGIDLVIVASISQDQLTPGAAPSVAAAVGALRAGAFDLGAACTGFVSGLSVAAAFIESRRASTILLVGGDVLSRNTDPTDRGTAIIFGDGVGAVVLVAGAAGRLGSAVLGADGSAADLITIERSDALIRMNGHETFQHAVLRMSESTVQVCEQEGLALADVDLFVFHQANARILTAISERLGLAPECVVNAIAESGNTSAGSIPLALMQARRDGQLTPGAKVIVGAFGAGLVWSSMLVEWGQA